MSKITNKTKLAVGDIVLLQSSLIGCIKYLGQLPGKKGNWIGIKLGEGTGDADGTHDGKTYFKCPKNKGVFVQRHEVKMIIKPEQLLDKVRYINKELKANNAKISELNDQINLSKSKMKETLTISPKSQQQSNPNSDSNEVIDAYLKQEIKKKWYITLEDLQARFKNRKANEVTEIYKNYKSSFEDLNEQPHHSRIVYTVASSRRGNLIASGSDDKTVRLWRRKGSGNNVGAHCIGNIVLRSCINSIAFSPTEDKLIAALDSGFIELYDLNSGKYCGALNGNSTQEVWTVGFSPDGNHIISGALDRAVRIWDVREQECKWALRGHTEWINGVSISQDGSTIVSGSGDKTVKLWDTKTMKCRGTLMGHTDFVRSVCVTSDSKWIASASDDATLRIWDIKSGDCKGVLKGHNKGIYCVSPGFGNVVASCSRDATINLWDVTKSKPFQKIKKHRGDVNSCCFVNDGKYVVSGSDDKQVMINYVM